jgi:UDP-N-acetylglucosamine--N-acetylmuramyl-(pentapeptide) pyrophosphoryl-undecaprenol N-acetylglucosamine transferase
MNLAVTGGGTGGHIYPALEIAKAAREKGSQVVYLGSLRGQEQELSARENFAFKGFPSHPLHSLKSFRGWKSLVSLLRSTSQVKSLFKFQRPDGLFSTGGYGAAPVMAAARQLGIPYVIHEANSIPGRSNRLFARGAFAFTCVFEKTISIIPNAVRTGQPIREALRNAANDQPIGKGRSLVLALGGSQGSAFINSLVARSAAMSDDPVHWLLAAGKSNFKNLGEKVESANLTIVPYLEASELVEAYRNARVVVARSGGTVAELAMFGLPSVLIPLPTSADNHQTENAEELVRIGGAKLLKQGVASQSALLDHVRKWLSDEEAYGRAQVALRNWDQPQATTAILKIVESAAGNK